MKLCLMNMMAHPIKLYLPKIARDAAQIFGEAEPMDCIQRISGDRFIGRLAMKTGMSMQYLLKIDAMLSEMFGATLLDAIQTLALEISSFSNNEWEIPPGQLINLVIEALDDKVETIKKGKMPNILSVHSMVVSALGTDFCKIQLGVVKHFLDHFLGSMRGGRAITCTAFQKLTHLYENTSFEAREAQRHLLIMCQLNERQNKRYLSALIRQFFDCGICSLPVSFILGGGPMIWGWKLYSGEMHFRPLEVGSKHYGTGYKPNVDGISVCTKMPFWGNLLFNQDSHLNDPILSDLNAITAELLTLQDFLSKACDMLNGKIVDNMARELRNLFRNTGCTFLRTQLQGFAVEFRNLIAGLGAVTSTHISLNNLRDSLTAMLFHVREFTPSGIAGLDYDQLLLAGSCASSPSTGSEGSVESEPEFQIVKIGNKLLRKAKHGESKAKCARKLQL